MIINGTQFNCDLSDVITELQLQLKLNDIPLIQKTIDTPKDIMIQCPYHGNGQERRPSAGIRKSDGTFHCFACQETHSLPEVISYCFGHYEDAFGAFGYKWLVKNFATVEVEERKDVELDFRRGTNRRLDNRFDNTINTGYINEEELDKYRYYHPYWKKRGITDEKIIELFDLGYDKTTDCITFPVRDINGNTLFIARRNVKSKFFNYPKGVEKPLYGLYELYQQEEFPKEVIICESMLDALTAWQFGRYALALNGLGNELQFKQLRELPCRKLILATDSDEAGMKARKRIHKNITNKLITEYIFPTGVKDLNDMVNRGFEELIEIF